MPAQTFPRHNRVPNTPTAVASALTRPKHITRAISPPTTSTSYSPTITSGGHQQRLNIITRVAIEGKAKQGQDGADIKMYFKMCLPLDSVTSGSTIPLFPEENAKILASQVHPIDNNSVPYNFSSTASPLLHNAARALNLPARSRETYDTAFDLSSLSDNSSISPLSGISHPANASSPTNRNIAPIDEKYTGHILISGYSISYVLPKSFPPHTKSDGYSEGNENGRPSFKSRRPSIGERNTVQFMAAIEMWIPYVSRPPRSPYLLSIPTPRCLHNNIKLRIFPPTATSASFASLSSVEEEGSSWDLTSDPHVTRNASTRTSRSNSYTHFADDESSDSSTAGFSDGCGIQGTFPSAERIRIRWAKPLKIIDVPGGGDGRRRVGVKEVKGEMICAIRGKLKDSERNDVEGVVMDVEYKGTCRGIWFPGVATLLGMDVGLETKGSDVSWIEGSLSEWNVGGGIGYTGFDVGSPRQSGPGSRTSSLDSNSPQILVSSESHGGTGLSAHTGRPASTSRQNSTSSTSSLLRAPLPAQNVPEYSFEGSAATIASSSSSLMGTVSSISSLTPGSTSNDQPSPHSRPGVPITLHININEIIPPAKNIFTFSISGTILITPRPTLSRSNMQKNTSLEYELDTDPEPVVLPRFTVLAADSESTSTLVRNEIEGVATTVEVYNSTGDIYRDAQARKTVLQRGGFTKCAEDGGRIALRSIGTSNGNTKLLQPATRPRTPNGKTIPHIASNSSLGRMIYPPRPKRDGPLMIPSVVATVTALVREDGLLPDGYAVRLCLNAPADTDSEWLEFGLGRPGTSSSVSSRDGDNTEPPTVEIASASVEGVPVKFDTAVSAASLDAGNLGVGFEEISSKEWVSWVKVHVGAVGGGVVVVDYVVTEGTEKVTPKRKARARNSMLLDVFLPTFPIPVGRLEVRVDTPSGVHISNLRSNFRHQQYTATGRVLLDYSMEGFFYPHLCLTIQVPSPSASFGLNLSMLVMWALLLSGFIFVRDLSAEIRQMGRSLENYSIVVGAGWNDIPEPVTITTTVYSTAGTRWWFGEVPTETEPVSVLLPTPGVPGAPTTTLPPSSPIAEVRPPPVSSPTTSNTETKEVSMASSGSPVNLYGLLPIPSSLPLPWSVRDLHATLDVILQTMEVVWQLMRKVYHYPLDPT